MGNLCVQGSLFYSRAASLVWWGKKFTSSLGNTLPVPLKMQMHGPLKIAASIVAD
jgi:hypothetical protein